MPVAWLKADSFAQLNLLFSKNYPKLSPKGSFHDIHRPCFRRNSRPHRCSRHNPDLLRFDPEQGCFLPRRRIDPGSDLPARRSQCLRHGPGPVVSRVVKPFIFTTLSEIYLCKRGHSMKSIVHAFVVTLVLT